MGLNRNSRSIQPPGPSTLPGFISGFPRVFLINFLVFSEREMHVKTEPSAVQIPQISSICSVYDINLLNALCKDKIWPWIFFNTGVLRSIGGLAWLHNYYSFVQNLAECASQLKTNVACLFYTWATVFCFRRNGMRSMITRGKKRH